MVRLKDIAQIAGVSIMTVSKVLRDAPDISAATKARVKLLADQMGYVPNSMAQGLRTRSSKTLGLIISAMTNPLYARMVMAIQESAFASGYQVLLEFSKNLPEQEETAIRRFLARRVDGILISPVYEFASQSTTYSELMKRDIPVVILGHTTDYCSGFINIETDDIQASYELTQHLIELGHSQIAFFTGPKASPWSEERFEGYSRALREARIGVNDSLIFTAGSTIAEGRKAALQFLQEAPKATALQAANDLIAIGVAEEILKAGHRIPNDFSLTGFGNILTSEFYRVPLTTVRQPKHRLGTQAMEVMKTVLKGEKASSMRLPAELQIRESTAPPPGDP